LLKSFLIPYLFTEEKTPILNKAFISPFFGGPQYQREVIFLGSSTHKLHSLPSAPVLIG